jgi:hypothetical protein
MLRSFCLSNCDAIRARQKKAIAEADRQHNGVRKLHAIYAEDLVVLEAQGVESWYFFGEIVWIGLLDTIELALEIPHELNGVRVSYTRLHSDRRSLWVLGRGCCVHGGVVAQERLRLLVAMGAGKKGCLRRAMRGK